MTNTNCKHCQSSCKTLGKKSCDKYNPISNRPEQLKQKIKEAYKNGDYELGKKYSEELFRINHGWKINVKSLFYVLFIQKKVVDLNQQIKTKNNMGRNKLPEGERLGVLRVQIKEKYLTKELTPKLKIVAEKAVIEYLNTKKS